MRTQGVLDMLFVNDEHLKPWLATVRKEIQIGVNRSSVSLWSFLRSSTSDTMFSGQSSKEFYESFPDTEAFFNIRNLIRNAIESNHTDGLSTCKVFLETRLLPQKTQEIDLTNSNVLNSVDTLYFPWVTFISNVEDEPEEYELPFKISPKNEALSVSYAWNELRGDLRRELCDYIFEPCLELSAIENLQVLKRLTGFSPMVKVPL